jgi:uncharacterized membrane protein
MTDCKQSTRDVNNENAVPQKILVLFILGFFITFVGIMILMVASTLYSQGSANFGAVIFIGPIPIVIGAGPQATWMVLFAVILAALSIMMYLIMRRGILKKNV